MFQKKFKKKKISWNFKIDHEFKGLIECLRTRVVTVDDMLVKSLKADEHINDLRESFEVLRE